MSFAKRPVFAVAEVKATGASYALWSHAKLGLAAGKGDTTLSLNATPVKRRRTQKVYILVCLGSKAV